MIHKNSMALEKGKMQSNTPSPTSANQDNQYTQEVEQVLQEMVQADPSIPSIDIVEKCCVPQTRSHLFGFGGAIKVKDMKDGTFLNDELLSALHSTKEDDKSLNEQNKSLNEKNKSLNDHLSTLEDEMKEIRKMHVFFAAQQSHITPTTSPVTTEWPISFSADHLLFMFLDNTMN